MSSGFNVDVNGYMFGSILAMSRDDVVFSVVLSIVILVLFILFYNRLFLITFDENFAKASGINVGFYQFLIALLTALTVVMGMAGLALSFEMNLPTGASIVIINLLLLVTVTIFNKLRGK